MTILTNLKRLLITSTILIFGHFGCLTNLNAATITSPAHSFTKIKTPANYHINPNFNLTEQILWYLQTTKIINKTTPFIYNSELEKHVFPIATASGIDGISSSFTLFDIEPLELITTASLEWKTSDAESLHLKEVGLNCRAISNQINGYEIAYETIQMYNYSEKLVKRFLQANNIAISTALSTYSPGYTTICIALAKK